ncbi:MAG: N-succinylarginine dihydrolase [Planctomycetota bacterium]
MTPSPPTLELKLDGLVGPTHNYAGLAPGNLAAAHNRHAISYPKAAALEGLAKMRLLLDLGIPQGFLPPHPRPNLGLLRRLGFTGSDAAVLRSALRQAPELLATACSAAAMWTANAATVCPSADSADHKVHFTPANLIASPHRAQESATTAQTLKRIFANPNHFVHHPPLPAAVGLGDEGAANHTRFCSDATQPDAPGVHLFVFGQPATPRQATRKFAPRQTETASRAVARLHRLDPDQVVFAQQHPDAIDAGVFHHDVIGVGHRNLLLVHEAAFANRETTLRQLRDRVPTLRIVEISHNELSLEDAVRTYLFNSQLVTTPVGDTVLIAHQACAEHPGVRQLLDRCIAQGHLDAVRFIDVQQSMRNGGGPACLRLRVELTTDQLAAVHPGYLLDAAKLDWLTRWVERRYPDQLTPDALASPDLLYSSQEAWAELDQHLSLDSSAAHRRLRA